MTHNQAGTDRPNHDPHIQSVGPKSWEQIARGLFDLLDEIDTADDLAKSDEKLYRNLVRRHHQGRFQYASTDGYTVDFNVKENDT
jgi:hypothetical protein